VRQDLDQQRTQECECVEFAGKALVQIVLSATNASVDSWKCTGVTGKLKNVARFR